MLSKEYSGKHIETFRYRLRYDLQIITLQILGNVAQTVYRNAFIFWKCLQPKYWRCSKMHWCTKCHGKLSIAFNKKRFVLVLLSEVMMLFKVRGVWHVTLISFFFFFVWTNTSMSSFRSYFFTCNDFNPCSCRKMMCYSSPYGDQIE